MKPTAEIYAEAIKEEIESVYEHLTETTATNKIFKNGYLAGLASAGLILETLGDKFLAVSKVPAMPPELQAQTKLTAGGYHYLSSALSEQIHPYSAQLDKEQTNAPQ